MKLSEDKFISGYQAKKGSGSIKTGIGGGIMDRKDELILYKTELAQNIPAALDSSAERAIAKVKKHHKHALFWKAPSISMATALVAFVLLVNLFPKVALAMSDVPILSELVAAVAFDPSLKAAVEHDYYQVVNESQTQEDVTVTVEYMILDAGHISIFFKVNAPVNAGIYSYDFRTPDGNGLSAAICNDTMYEVGKLEEINLDFVDGSEIPGEFTFTASITKDPEFQKTKTVSVSSEDDQELPPSERETTAVTYHFSFVLYPKETFRQAMEQFPIHQWLEFDGQKVYIDCLNVYPTQARLQLSCDTNNSAILKALDINFTDEHGTVYDTKANGITGTQSPDTLNLISVFFESSYFSDASHLNMFINGASFLDKTKLYGSINYKDKTISNLPEGVTIASMELNDTSLSLTLRASTGQTNKIEQLISSTYYDNERTEYFFHSWNSSSDEENHSFDQSYQIENFIDNMYLLQWCYSPMKFLRKPIEINLK